MREGHKNRTEVRKRTLCEAPEGLVDLELWADADNQRTCTVDSLCHCGVQAPMRAALHAASISPSPTQLREHISVVDR